MPYLQVVRVPHGCRRGEDGCAPTVAPAEKLVTCSSELRGSLFRALYTGTGPGVVSTGTRPP